MNRPAYPLPPEVQAALREGDQILAIRRLRESTGLGLKEAKELVDQHVRREPVAPGAFDVPAAATDTLPENVLAVLQQGSKLEAIRLLREAGGLSLKKAKEAVESHARNATARPDKLSPGEVPRSTIGLWVAAALVALAVGYYLLSRSG